jgi:FtsZ-interacting cell division protein ZipA
MSLSMMIIILFVLFAIVFAVIWRNMQQQRKPRRRFKIGGTTRNRSHPVRSRRMSYTEMARQRRAKSSEPPPATDPPSDKTPEKAP